MIKLHFLSPKGRPIDEVQMARRGLAAMLGGLGDPFTNYIPPVQLDTYKSKKKETVVGIGLQVEYDVDGVARIISPLIDGPSDLPELECGMDLLAVDDRPVTGLEPAGLNKLLHGTEGTEVQLRVARHENVSSAFNVKVRRGSANIEFMKFTRLANDVLFVRIAWFSGTGHANFVETIEQYVVEGVRGIILDIRSNSGGSIISTRNIFSSLCDEEIMYYGVNARNEKIKDRQLGAYRFDLPLTVLINQATFSAGEVLCGAFRDYGRAKLVGSCTAGKGSMQQVFPLEGLIGGALRVTTATNCTPNGQVVQGNGITPDVEVPLAWPELFVDDGPQNIRDQGRELLKKIRFEKLCNNEDNDALTESWLQGDQQLSAALSLLQSNSVTNKP